MSRGLKVLTLFIAVPVLAAESSAPDAVSIVEAYQLGQQLLPDGSIVMYGVVHFSDGSWGLAIVVVGATTEVVVDRLPPAFWPRERKEG